MAPASVGARVSLRDSRRIKARFSRAGDRPIAQIVFVHGDIQNPVQRISKKLLMKNRMRFIIESVFDKLKSETGLENTGHRFPVNVIVHFLSRLVADTVGKARNQNTNFRLSVTRVDKNPIDAERLVLSTADIWIIRLEIRIPNKRSA